MGQSGYIRPETLPALTSLRFMAAMMVVFMHTSSAFGWEFIPRHFIFGLGVSFFFILSGFILTHNYLHRNVPFTTFIQNRWARLWPAHLLWLAAVFILLPPGWWTFDGPGLLSKWVTLVANIFMMHSIVPIQDYYFSWNAVSWSISTEFFLYLAFYPLLKNIRHTWRCKLLITLFIFLSLDVIQHWFPITGMNITFAIPPARVLEFFLGMTAYLIWEKTREGKLWIAFLITAVPLFLMLPELTSLLPILSKATQFIRVGLLCGYAALACLIISLAGNHTLARIVGVRPFVYLGEISYSLYLCHQVFIRMFLSQGPDGFWASLSPPLQAALYFPIIFSASCLSYHIVEIPLRKMLRSIDFQRYFGIFKQKKAYHPL
ncbi:MAG: acyltransferase [Desulfovibrio sp.]|jgi:peptidoglycan/LPS O-acetylase OafA/YrhL|nr:acyltransferase [Desulfovibrio sp.]